MHPSDQCKSCVICVSFIYNSHFLPNGWVLWYLQLFTWDIVKVVQITTAKRCTIIIYTSYIIIYQRESEKGKSPVGKMQMALLVTLSLSLLSSSSLLASLSSSPYFCYLALFSRVDDVLLYSITILDKKQEDQLMGFFPSFCRFTYLFHNLMSYYLLLFLCLYSFF